MASSTDVFPLPLGPEISTDFPSRVVSRMPNRFLIVIFVVFIDILTFYPYDRGEVVRHGADLPLTGVRDLPGAFLFIEQRGRNLQTLPAPVCLPDTS